MREIGQRLTGNFGLGFLIARPAARPALSKINKFCIMNVQNKTLRRQLDRSLENSIVEEQDFGATKLRNTVATVSFYNIWSA